MITKNNLLKNIMVSAIICTLVFSTVVFFVAPDIAQQLHLWSLRQRGQKYNVLLIVNDLDQNDLVTANSISVYNTLCTLGLQEAVTNVFDDVQLSYTFTLVETDKQPDLNSTYLDSFDLIIVGGITYWWEYASSEDSLALIQTQTPIFSSVNLGVGSSILDELTGVYTNKTPEESWSTSVLPPEENVIKFTNYLKSPLIGLTSSFRWYMLDMDATDHASVIAYVERKGVSYPYVVFNGTKNYYINTYTYKGSEQIEDNAYIVLDLIFDICHDDYLVQKFGVASNRTVLNSLLIPIVSLFSCYLAYSKLQFRSENKTLNKVKAKNFKKAFSLSTLVLIICLLVILILKTYFPNSSIDDIFSVEYLVGATCIFVAIETIMQSYIVSHVNP